MALKAMWIGYKYKRVYVQLNGTVVLPTDCRCIAHQSSSSRGGGVGVRSTGMPD